MSFGTFKDSAEEDAAYQEGSEEIANQTEETIPGERSQQCW